MARLLINTEGLERRWLNLNNGTTVIGRSSDSDFFLDHPTISSRHCELILSGDGLFIRDCNSTNGTFVNREPIKETWLQDGQTLQLGQVVLLVESAPVQIAIPQFQPVSRNSPKTAFKPSSTGLQICPQHSRALANYHCVQCCKLMCAKCVHVLKRQGGHAMLLCPFCSGRCERVNLNPTPRKRTFFEVLRRTARLPFSAMAAKAGSKPSAENRVG